MVYSRGISKARCVVCAAVTLALASAAWASDTQLVTVTLSGNGNAGAAATAAPSISDDGRYVAFQSDAYNLVPGLPLANFCDYVYVRDTVAGTTTRIGAIQPNFAGNWSRHPVISGDGSTVIFESSVAHTASDFNTQVDVYSYSVASGTIEVVSGSWNGTAGGGRTFVEGVGANPSVVSQDGNYVAFQSTAPLAFLDSNGVLDVYVRDRSIAFTRLESATASGSAGNGASSGPALSADGGYVVFSTLATDIVGASTPGIYRKDRISGAMIRADVDGNSNPVLGLIRKNYALSGNAQSLAYTVDGANPGFGDTTAFADIYVTDFPTQTISLASRDSSGGPTNGHSLLPEISFDGRYVMFTAEGSDLITLDTTGSGAAGADLIVRDRVTARNALINVTDAIYQVSPGFVTQGSMSPDGRYFAFLTFQKLGGALDPVISADVYRRDRIGFADMPGGKHGISGLPQLHGTGSINLPYALPQQPIVPEIYLQLIVAEPSGAAASNAIQMAF